MQMTGPFNPFRQSTMFPQQTGMPFQQPFMQPQQTGFNPQQPNFAQPQPFLQPQFTGQLAFGTGSLSNRQSMFPQQTGASPFGQFGQMGQNGQNVQHGGMQQTGFGQQPNFAQPQPQALQPQATGSNPFRQSMMLNTSNVNASGALSQPTSPFAPFQPNNQNSSGGQTQIQRPGSTPALSLNTKLPSFGTANTADAKPLTAQATGSKNPFAPPGGIQPKAEPVSKGPSMNELAWGKHQGMSAQQTGLGGLSSGFNLGSQQSGSGSQPSASPWGATSPSDNKPSGSGNGISDIASSFTFDKSPSTNPTGSSSNDFMSQFGSLSMGNTGTGSTSPFSSLSSNPTGQMSPTKTGPNGGFLQPQTTGYGGSTVKRFQPTSSFGNSLMETLPPIPEPSANNPSQSGSTVASPAGGIGTQNTGFPFSPNNGGAGGLTQSMTGVPNPFRQSMAGGPQQPAFGGMPANAGAFGASSPFAGQNRPPQQNQPFTSNNLM
jgi:hypothetical protein